MDFLSARSILLSPVLFLVFITFTNSGSNASKCEQIQVPQCKAMPWTLTHMPNLVHHSSQENARLVLSQFEPLLLLPCSTYLRFFLCSMFTPMCFQHEGDFPKIVPPCRTICQHARSHCEPIMLKYNVTWPEQFSCEVFPEYDRGMCITPEAFIPTPVNEEPVCSATNPVVCPKCRKFKVRDKSFVEQDYDFVIRAKVEKVTKNPCDADLRVNITQVYRSRSVTIIPGLRTLIFNNSCPCPNVKRQKEYLFAGHEDARAGKLLLHPHSLADKWGKRSGRKISKWIKKKAPKNTHNRRSVQRRGRRKKAKKSSPASTK